MTINLLGKFEKKISNGVRAAHVQGCYEKKNQRPLTETHRKKLSKAKREAWKRGCHSNHSECIKAAWIKGVYNRCSEAMKEAWRRGAFDGVFNSPSSIELEVAAALDDCGILYTEQYRLEGDSHPFDFFVPSAAMLIEVDGIYWHSLAHAQKRDRLKDRLAKEYGFALLRISEGQLKEIGALAIIQEQILPITTCVCGG